MLTPVVAHEMGLGGGGELALVAVEPQPLVLHQLVVLQLGRHARGILALVTRIPCLGVDNALVALEAA